MKTSIWTFLIVIIFLPYGVLAQEISRWVFSAGGDQYESDQISLSATMGQSGLAGILENESLVITAGFQQMEDLGTTSTQTWAQHIVVKVYPNPFSDQFTLELQGQEQGYFDYYLYDIQGRMILSKENNQLLKQDHQEIINISGIPSATYHLLVRVYNHSDGDARYSYTVIKQ